MSSRRFSRRVATVLTFGIALITSGNVACRNADTVSGPLGRTFVVSGIVRKGGIPTGGIHVSLGERFDGATTAADGSFAFDHVPAGTWTLTVKTGCAECAEFQTRVTVPPDATGVDLIWEED